MRLEDTVAPAPKDALILALPVPVRVAARLREALGGREGVPPLEAVAVRVSGAVRVEAASASAPPAPAPRRGPREAEGRRGVGVAMTVLEREAGREGVGETQAEGVGEDVNKMEADGDGYEEALRVPQPLLKGEGDRVGVEESHAEVVGEVVPVTVEDADVPAEALNVLE